MKNKSYINKFKRGFTLIELLLVITIIGILASVVLVSTKGATLKAKRASAITSASSVLPELVTCQDDIGFAKNTAPPTGGTTPICCTTLACAVVFPGHSTTWPNITNTGWSYGTPTGTLANSDYQYTLTKPGETTITCSYASNGCS